MTGQYPFEGETVFKLFDNIARAEFNIPDMVGPSLSSLLRGMLLKDPEKRLGIFEIQQHESVHHLTPVSLSSAYVSGLYELPRCAVLGHECSVYISLSESTAG